MAAETSSGSYEGKAEVPYTLDERRRAALEEIDAASFSWFHIKVAAVAGVGFLTDAYDIFAISIAASMIGFVYGVGKDSAKTLTPNQDLALKIATPVGTFVGQLFFGWLADVVGRKKMYGVELMIIIVATFAQALSGQASAISIIGVLVVWRFIMGVGIGGDYPLSATITSEFSSTRIRGRMMTAVFASQGWGNLLAAIVGLIVTVGYKHRLLNDAPNNLEAVDHMWRLLIGLGCVPACIALYFRLTIPETPRFTMDIERNVQQASQDVDTFLTKGTFYADPDAAVTRVAAPKASRRDFIAHFSKWENGKVLLGTSWSWFALDVAFYGLGLNTSIVLNAIGWAGKTGTPALVYDNLYKVCVGNIILSVGGLVPGYWATFLFIDTWGRKPIQLMGFIMLTILFCIMGFAYDKLVHTTPAALHGFVVLYCFTNFFQNFGPNTTTFVVPGEVFPTRYRSTSHGISAASGKLGAIVAQAGFAQLRDRGGKNAWIKHILQIFALFMLTGIFSTLLIPETNQRTLEDLSNEDQHGFVQGPARAQNETQERRREEATV